MSTRVTRALLIGVAICGLVAACGSDADSTTSSSKSSASIPSPSIAEPTTAKVYDVGQTADAGVAVVTVTGVVDPKDPGDSIFQPSPDGRFILVNFEITNKAPEALNVRAGQCQILDSTGKIYGDYPSPDGFAGASIAPGATEVATMTFDVPAAQTDVRFRVEPPTLTEGKPVEFRLTN